MCRCCQPNVEEWFGLLPQRIEAHESGYVRPVGDAQVWRGNERLRDRIQVVAGVLGLRIGRWLFERDCPGTAPAADGVSSSLPPGVLGLSRWVHTASRTRSAEYFPLRRYLPELCHYVDNTGATSSRPDEAVFAVPLQRELGLSYQKPPVRRVDSCRHFRYLRCPVIRYRVSAVSIGSARHCETAVDDRKRGSVALRWALRLARPVRGGSCRPKHDQKPFTSRTSIVVKASLRDVGSRGGHMGHC